MMAKKPFDREEVLTYINSVCLRQKIFFLLLEIQTNNDCDCDNCGKTMAIYKEELDKAKALYEKPEGKLN